MYESTTLISHIGSSNSFKSELKLNHPFTLTDTFYDNIMLIKTTIL